MPIRIATEQVLLPHSLTASLGLSLPFGPLPKLPSPSFCSVLIGSYHTRFLGYPTLWLRIPKPKIGYPEKEYGMSL